MKSFDSQRKLTPCGMALLVAPIVFLVLPNGIPFLYASHCNSAYATNATSLGLQQATCVAGGTWVVKTSSPTLTSTSGKCEITVETDVLINTGFGTDCAAEFAIECEGAPCEAPPVLIGTGPGTFHAAQTLKCAALGDDMKVVVQRLNGVCGGCSPTIVLQATALCGTLDP